MIRISATSFVVDGIEAEHARLIELGVVFAPPPTAMGSVTSAVLDDACGHLIPFAQVS